MDQDSLGRRKLEHRPRSVFLSFWRLFISRDLSQCDRGVWEPSEPANQLCVCSELFHILAVPTDNCEPLDSDSGTGAKGEQQRHRIINTRIGVNQYSRSLGFVQCHDGLSSAVVHRRWFCALSRLLNTVALGLGFEVGVCREVTA